MLSSSILRPAQQTIRAALSPATRPIKAAQATFLPFHRRLNTSPVKPTTKKHLPRTRMASRPAQASDAPINREAVEQLLKKRFFYAPAFEIYSGPSGFYDYGPPGAALQANIIDLWRKHFIIEEEMLEVDTVIMTPAEVLKTSGHVDKFTDWMTKDVKNGNIYRADHLIEAVLEARLKGDKEARGKADAPAQTEADAESTKKSKKKVVKSDVVKLDDKVVQEYETVLAQIDNYTGAQMWELMKKYDIKAPDTKNDLTEPVEFNLMFDSSIGPTGLTKGYLRPETAQGHFVNFGRLLEYNGGRIPFASAQIGKSFRNEISPRQGLLRVREFLMAEIEHYVDPRDKSHRRFEEVKDLKLRLLPKETQAAGKTDILEITIGDAVEKKIVDNQTLGYFIARIYLFLDKIGIDPQRLRFRQHMANEMAHYAADCWDAEIYNSYGWIECVGCADRSAYDLTVHAVRTKKNLSVQEPLPADQVKTVEKLVAVPDPKVFAKEFKKDNVVVKETLVALEQDRLECIRKELEEKKSSAFTAADGNTYTLTPELVKIEKKSFKETTRTYTPNVIEPSFGIGRILYSLLEHSFWIREGSETRNVLSLPPSVAPVKVLVVPLDNKGYEEFRPFVADISRRLRSIGISCKVDDSGVSIGKKYSRNDELGIPYGITIDRDTKPNGTITLRDRDSTLQRIGKIDDVIQVVSELCSYNIDWDEACKRLPAREIQDTD